MFKAGNKRAGIAAVGLFLRLNGGRLAAGNPDLEAFALNVATGERAAAETAAWLREHSQPD